MVMDETRKYSRFIVGYRDITENASLLRFATFILNCSLRRVTGRHEGIKTLSRKLSGQDLSFFDIFRYQMKTSGCRWNLCAHKGAATNLLFPSYSPAILSEWTIWDNF